MIVMVHFFHEIAVANLEIRNKRSVRRQTEVSVETREGRSRLLKTLNGAKLVPSKITNTHFYGVSCFFLG